MKFIVLFGLALGALAANPGLRIQLNQPGLDYARNLAVQQANIQVKQAHIPDYSGSQSILQYKLSSFNIQSFNIPNSNTRFTLSQPSTVTLASSGISASLTCNYKITVGSGWLSISKSGSISMSASSTSLSQAVGLTQAGGKPHVNAGHCSASVGHLSITFHGSLVDSIINLFTGIIEDYVKGSISSAICSAFPAVINGANSELNKVPTSKNLGKGYNIDYSLTANPSVAANNQGITVPFLAKIWYQNHQNDASNPLALPMSIVQSTDKMACMAIQPHGMLGSFGYASHISGNLDFGLTKSVFAKYNLAQYMQCSCPGSTCVGSLIPQIANICYGGSIQVLLKSQYTPKVQTNTTGLYMQFGWQFTFQVVPTNPQKSPNTFLIANIDVGAVLQNLAFSNWNLQGEFHFTTAHTTVIRSDIGPVNLDALDIIFWHGLVPVLEGKVNSQLMSGIPLPELPDFKIISPVITTTTNQLAICGNGAYTG